MRNSVLDGANLNFVDIDGTNMASARIKVANHAFASTLKSTIWLEIFSFFLISSTILSSIFLFMIYHTLFQIRRRQLFVQ